ncbi:hypothetical protein JT163_06760, partial [Helicobacter pylori]|nr:hypothetical protein [Helicobacter pylori]
MVLTSSSSNPLFLGLTLFSSKGFSLALGLYNNLTLTTITPLYSSGWSLPIKHKTAYKAATDRALLHTNPQHSQKAKRTSHTA